MAYGKKYFAAANTADGFESYFPDIFAPEKLSRLYIIKGGPGTGKSTMMKQVADEAVKRGYAPELYYCSSDPDSLDGVLIPELSAAIVDGTAPHLTDPKYPGAVDVILDFGAYFDRRKLRERREEIISLCRKNSEQYKKAMAYYSHAAAAAREAAEICAACVDFEKLSKTAKRTADRIAYGAGAAKHRQITAFSTRGAVRLDTFEREAEKRIAVCESRYEGASFIGAVCAELALKGVSYEYNVMNVMPERYDAVYVPGTKTLIELAGKPDKITKQKYDKMINAGRFTDKKRLAESKTKLGMLKKLEISFYCEAAAAMRAAGELHDKIEAIYKNAVDFDGVRELMSRVIKEIFED